MRICDWSSDVCSSDLWDGQILPQLPDGINGSIPYDGTEYIQDAIDEVIQTIVEAVIIVLVVIFLFLGSLRSVLIPAVRSEERSGGKEGDGTGGSRWSPSS